MEEYRDKPARIQERGRRSRVFWLGMLSIATLLGITGLFGIFIWPYDIQLREVIIGDGRLSSCWHGLTLMQISDLHLSGPDKREKMLLDMVTEIRPDLIVITGDLAQWDSPPDEALAFVSRLRAPLGVYAVLGDSDLSSGRRHCLFCHPRNNFHALRTHPEFLRDQFVHVDLHDGRRLTIVGIHPNTEAGELQRLTSQAARDSSDPVLILSQFSLPCTGLSVKNPTLCLCGDTHGGQILLPRIFWKLLGDKPDPDHMAGLYQLGESHYLYVNRGIGTSIRLPIRIGVRPEVTIFRFE